MREAPVAVCLGEGIAPSLQLGLESENASAFVCGNDIGSSRSILELERKA